MRKDVAWLAVIALGTFAVGFSARAIATGVKSVGSEAVSVREAVVARPSALIRSGDAADPEVAALKKRFAVSEGVASWLNLIAELEKASPEDMPRIAAAVGDDYQGLHLVARRWFELDPEQFFEATFAEAVRVVELGATARRYACFELLDYLFNEWPKHDLAAAVAALEFETDAERAVDDMISLRGELIEAVTQFDYARALEIGKRWGIELSYDTEAFRRWATADPRAAIDAILIATPTGGGDPDDPFGHLDWGDDLNPLAEVWAKRDPAGALSADLPNNVAWAIRGRVFEIWAASDRERATEWLEAHGSDATKERLRAILVGEWGREDPAAALAWSQENIEHPTHLAAALIKIVNAGAATDPALVAGILESIETSDAKEWGYTTLAEAWFPEYSSSDPIPPAAVAWLRGIEDAEIREKAVGSINRRWIRNEAEGFQAFLDDPKNLDLGSSPYTNFARSMARRDPLHALEWAEGLGGDRAIYVTFAAFDAWMPHRPAAAVEWFQSLPVDDARRTQLLDRIVYQAGANPSHQFILETLSDADKARALTGVERAGLSEERERQVRRILAE